MKVSEVKGKPFERVCLCVCVCAIFKKHMNILVNRVRDIPGV